MAKKKETAKKVVYKPHKTKRITLRTIDVDIHIIPVVKWLNSLEDVTTLYSCQGDDKIVKGKLVVVRPAYVTFTCPKSAVLATILDRLKFYGKMEVDYYENAIRYQMIFQTTKTLNDFIESKHIPDKYKG